VLSFTRTVAAAAPIDMVFDHLADFTTVNDWDPRTTNAERIHGDGGPGSLYTCRMFHLARATAMTFTLVSATRPTEVQWVGRSRYLTQRDVMRFRQAVGGPTVVEVTSFFCYPAIHGKREALLAPPLRDLSDRRQCGLQAALDAWARRQASPSTPAA
jgi:hypothetical protein